MLLQLLFIFAFSQTVTTSPLITNFEEEWNRYQTNGSISKTNLENWMNAIWAKAKYKSPEEETKNKEYLAYSNDQILRQIAILNSKGVDNKEAIKELIHVNVLLQEARARYNLEPTSSDLFLAIEKYQNMARHLDTAIFGYDREGKYKKGWFDASMDVAAVKNAFSGWDYNVRHVRYVSQDTNSFSLPSDQDLMDYNRAYCDCVINRKQIAIKARRDCAHETVDTEKACDVFPNNDPGAQPVARRLQDCGPGKVYIFPYATAYFLNGTCTLDLTRAKGFLQKNAPRSSSGGAR